MLEGLPTGVYCPGRLCVKSETAPFGSPPITTGCCVWFWIVTTAGVTVTVVVTGPVVVGVVSGLVRVALTVCEPGEVAVA